MHLCQIVGLCINYITIDRFDAIVYIELSMPLVMIYTNNEDNINEDKVLYILAYKEANFRLQ